MHRTSLVTALASACALLIAAPAGATTFDVSNANDTGPGSLRRAIAEANVSPGHDDIKFNNINPQVITPNLPPLTITDPVTIDGGGTIGIDARNVPDGLQVDANDSTIRGLAIYLAANFIGAGAPYGNGVSITGNGNRVEDNLLGTNLGGVAPLGNTVAGVRVAGNGNTIAGNTIIDNLQDGSADRRRQ